MKAAWIKILMALPMPAAAWAQFTTTFEPPTYAGSTSGVPLAGQDGFYVPSGVDGLVFTYAGNTLGVVDNPGDSTDQFIACIRRTGDFSRVEHAVPLEMGCYTVEADINLTYQGTLPTQNYAGSISLQPFPGPGSIIVLFNWDNVQSPTNFTVRVLGYAADGTVPYLAGLPVPNLGFQHLHANRWYRLRFRVEFGVNRITTIAIKDLHLAGDFASYFPTAPNLDGWYCGGGSTYSGVPGAIRVFGGGGFATDNFGGNTLALDSTSMFSSVTTCVGDVDLDQDTELTDLAILLTHFGTASGALYADGDLDCDGDVDLFDLSILLSNYGTNCAMP
jgi:hypothetical protein